MEIDIQGRTMGSTWIFEGGKAGLNLYCPNASLGSLYLICDES